MSNLSLTNFRNGSFTNIQLVYNNDNKNILDIFCTKEELQNVIGLPPTTLDTLQELAAALNNNPDFFNYVQSQLNLKMNTSDCYNKNYIDTLILNYYTISQINNLLNDKLNSNVINNYYTKTESDAKYATLSDLSNNITTVNNNLALKVNATDLVNDYFNKVSINNLFTSYYNKLYIDNLISQYNTKAEITNFNYINNTTLNSSLSNYYTKTNIDTTFYTKANIDTNIYTKTQVDTITTAINNNVYTKTQIDTNYYTKAQVDTITTTINNNKLNITDATNTYYTKTYIDNLSNNYYQKIYVDNLTTTVNSCITSITDIQTTVPSLLTSATFNDAISSYLTKATFTASSLVNTTTLGSYLTINSFTTSSLVNNTTLGSYLKTANFSTTIGSYLTTTAFNNTLTSKLSTKLDKNVFTIPNTGNVWILLGSISTTQNGNIATFEINSNNYYSGNAADEMRCSIQFSTSNGSANTVNGDNGSPFYGEATITGTNNVVNTNFAIEQVSNTSYKFYYYTGAYPGNSVFSVNSYSVFTYSGTQTNPTGCFIYPTLIYTIGVNNNGDGELYIAGVHSDYWISKSANYNLYDNGFNNIATFNMNGSTINSTLSTNKIILNNGKIYEHNYLTYNALVMSHNYGMAFGISSAVPPAYNDIKLTIDGTTGVCVNDALTVNKNLAVSGGTNFQSDITFPNASATSIYCSANITGNNFLVNGNITTKGTLQTTYLTVLQSAMIPKLNVPTSITTTSILLQNGGFITCPGTFKMQSTTGIQTWNNGTITSALSDSSNGLYSDTLVSKSALGGDTKLTIQNQVSGTASLYFSTNGTNNSRLYQDTFGNINLSVNISSTSALPISIYPNGVVNCNGGNLVNNKQLVLYESGATDTPSTATSFFGFGVNSATLRYQVSQVSHSHKFYCGSTLSYTITNGAGTSGSDARWKTDVQDIKDALDKVKQLQGKTFIYNGCSGRQLGMIAQDVKPIVPEVVMVDDDGYHMLCYDRLVALLCESIKELEKRVQILENKI